MSSEESISASAMPAREATRRNAHILLGFLLCCLAALVVALSLSPGAVRGQQQQVGQKAVYPILPSAGDGKVGLPYETSPASQGSAPTAHGGPDAFGYI